MIEETPMTLSIPGLVSTRPDPELKDALMLFGQFVGSWHIQLRFHKPDGSTEDQEGEVHYGWILDGRAIQDVWISHRGTGRMVWGTTLRYPEPSLEAWRCVWIAPRRQTLQIFLARQIGDEIVLEAQHQGKP